ncbi:MAG: hypothetical protein GAK28_03052 [Luteibacter sp.]|uniref:tetratricopeptide repeat protein n=1 Tax=Luteibacter sp. TaxID=1886636 RepID=UPI001383A95F|nr:tetratricopeptide repeat protein [Luteibacter sp.]KAF1005831.1 MAG: hypothetical protein GAK28_03052 [Luteibacter sp.]
MGIGIARRVAWLGVVALSGCAGHGTLPADKHGADIAQEQAEAARAYADGDIRRAASLYEDLVGAVPDDADLWFRLGNARFRLQEVDDAVTAYSRATQIDPNHAKALYNLGVVRLKQAQAAMLSSARASQPGDPLRRDGARIAQRLARAGDDMDAAGHVEGGAPPSIIEVGAIATGQR